MDKLIELQVTLPSDTFTALQRAAQRQNKSEAEFARDAIRAYLENLGIDDPLIGMFSDEPELIDEITESAMQARSNVEWREAE